MAFENWDRLVNEARQRKAARERTNKEKTPNRQRQRAQITTADRDSKQKGHHET